MFFILNRSSGIVYDTDVQAFITRWEIAEGTTMTTNMKGYLDTLVTGLKTASLYTPIYEFYPVIGTVTASCFLAFKSATRNATNAGVTSVTSSGIKPTTGGVQVPFSASDVNVSKSHSMGIYSTESGLAATGNLQVMGTRNSTTQAFELGIRHSSQGFVGTAYQTSNDGRISSVGTTASNGFFVISRTSNTDFRIFRNGSQVGSTETGTNNGTVPTVSPQNMNMTYGPRSAFHFYATGLNTTQVSALSTLVNAFMTSRGINQY